MARAPSTFSTDASYRTLFTIAVGGMGQVDLAVRREGSFERLFAIKRLRPQLLDEAEVREMFVDEARIAGLVRHPNVVSVVDVGEDAAGPFAVMEFVEGVSVAQLLTQLGRKPLPLEIALRIAMQTAEGLHAAHELVGPDGHALELVHRDVSPQNILVGFDGIARVTDFGVAKALGRISKTSTGVLKGKLGYISPEQLRFEEPDRRADLFALGIVLFELLAGQRLYKNREGMDGPRRILSEPPPDLADYRDDADPELVELLFELLAKDRAARPATAKDVARRLEGVLATLTSSGTSVDTATFLAEHFADVQREMRERIARARDKPAEPAEPAKPAERIELAAAPRPPRRVVAWLFGVAGLATGVAAVAFMRDPAAPAPTVASSTPPPVVSIAEAPRPAAVPPDAAPPSASAPARLKPAQPPPAAPRRTPAASKEKPKSGVPLWESY